MSKEKIKRLLEQEEEARKNGDYKKEELLASERHRIKIKKELKRLKKKEKRQLKELQEREREETRNSIAKNLYESWVEDFSGEFLEESVPRHLAKNAIVAANIFIEELDDAKE